MLRQLLFSLILSAVFLTPICTSVPLVCAEAQTTLYVASINSNRYHKPSCSWVKKIVPANRISFQDESEAKEAECIPCKVCWPLSGGRNLAKTPKR